MSYEAWGDGEDLPECGDCEQAARDYEALEKVTGDLTQLVARLAHSLSKAAPDHDLPAKALDYLQREGLTGSPLRETPNALAQADAACGVSPGAMGWASNGTTEEE